MKGFIEIIGLDDKPHLLNIRQIEEVTPKDDINTLIYLCSSGTATPVLFTVHKPYCEIVNLIESAVNRNE